MDQRRSAASPQPQIRHLFLSTPIRYTYWRRCTVIAGNAYIMTPPKNTTATEGMRARLNCQAEGYPNNITYKWFKNGEDVYEVRIHGYCSDTSSC